MKGKGLIIYMIGVIFSVSILVYLNNNFITISKIVGTSMSPTYLDGERIFVKRNISLDKLDRGDIVVFYSDDGKEIYIKRVIGFPNDIIEYKEDRLYINNEEYSEPYLEKNKDILQNTTRNKSHYMNDFKEKIPTNNYYVLGDNRIFSTDSRNFGSINKNQIIGKPFKILGGLEKNE